MYRLYYVYHKYVYTYVYLYIYYIRTLYHYRVAVTKIYSAIIKLKYNKCIKMLKTIYFSCVCLHTQYESYI